MVTAMVNKGLFEQVRDQIIKTVTEDLEEVALAAMAAGVPASDIKIDAVSPYLTGYDRNIWGQIIFIGGLGIPITVKLY